MPKPEPDPAASLVLQLNEARADRNRTADERDHAVGERDKMERKHAEAETRADDAHAALKYVYDETAPGRRPRLLQTLRETLGPDVADAILGLDSP